MLCTYLLVVHDAQDLKIPVIAEQCNYLLLLLLLHSTSGLNNWTQEKNDLKLELFTSLVIKRGPERIQHLPLPPRGLDDEWTPNTFLLHFSSLTK
jgi:hypothetical protein